MQPQSNQGPINPLTSIPGAIIIAGALISVAIIWSLKPVSVNQPTAPTQPSQQAAVAQAQPSLAAMAPISASDHILGNPDAPVKMVTYSDPSCPYCKIFFPTAKQIIDTYGPSGKVALIYRNFPLINIHPNAFHESEALECAAVAGSNSAFWKMAENLYATTKGGPSGLDQSKLPDMAKAAGVDATKFNTCLATEQTKAKVLADIKDGNSIGVNGTPFSILISSSGNFPVSGAVPFSSLKAQIDALLPASAK